MKEKKTEKKLKVMKKRQGNAKKSKERSFKNYTPDALKNAINAIDLGTSFRNAASTFGIPLATLHRKKKHPEYIITKNGPPPVMSFEEENKIVEWITLRAGRGYPVTKSDLLDGVQYYLRNIKKPNPFTDDRPGRHWYEGFIKRHPSIVTKIAQHRRTSKVSVTEDNLRNWFSKQKGYLEKKNLLYIDSCRVFNCDETNIQLCPKPDTVLRVKDERSVYKVVDANEKKSFTVLFMCSADGTQAPPMIMYKYAKRVPKKISQNCPRGWGMGINDSGCVTTESFYEYISHVFYPWLIEKKVQFPVIIYLDGHSSHISIPLVSFCIQKGIELISLFPNSSHIMQPLAISFFHPFKESWEKTVHKWKLQNNLSQVTNELFPAVLKEALESFIEQKRAIINGFTASGLMPFDCNAINYDLIKYNNNNVKEECNEIENQLLPEVPIEDNKLHLQTFQKNLDPALLEEFRNAELIMMWTGTDDMKGLYEYWLKIKSNARDTQF